MGISICVLDGTQLNNIFLASQVAGFTASPEASHAKTVESIVRHLAGTSSKGLAIKPDGTFDLMAWADTDFAGTSKQGPSGSAKSVKWGCGRAMTSGGTPAMRGLQLTSETCLSTTTHTRAVPEQSDPQAACGGRSLDQLFWCAVCWRAGSCMDAS